MMRTYKWKYLMLTYIVAIIFSIYEILTTHNHAYVIIGLAAMTLLIYEIIQVKKTKMIRINLNIKTSIIVKIIIGLIFAGIIALYYIREMQLIKSGSDSSNLLLLMIVLIPMIIIIARSSQNSNRDK